MPAAVPQRTKTYTADELFDQVVVRALTGERVTALLGQPDSLEKGDAGESWTYRGLSMKNGQVMDHHFLFQEGKVIHDWATEPGNR